jgi:hypothetical protein
VRAGQRDGSVRRGDPDRMARAVLLTAQSFVLSSALFTDGYGDGDLDAELRAVLDRYLAA